MLLTLIQLFKCLINEESGFEETSIESLISTGQEIRTLNISSGHITRDDVGNVQHLSDLSIFAASTQTTLESPISFAKNAKLQRVILDSINSKLSNNKIYGQNLQYFSSQTLMAIPFNAFQSIDAIEIKCPMVESVQSEAFLSAKVRNLYLPALHMVASSAFNGAEISDVEFDSVDTLGASAFANANIAIFRLPKLTVVPTLGFSNNLALTTIDLLSVETISTEGFANCVNLAHVNVPSLQTIGDSCFFRCTSLETFNASISVIEEKAFYSCKSLKSVHINANDVVIVSQAFALCSSLAIVETNSIKMIGGSAFTQCTALANVTGLESTAKLDAWAFKEAYIWTDFRFDKITTIAQNTFQSSCIKSISVPFVTFIDNSAFDKCSYLHTLYAPNLTTIGHSICNECPCLVSIDFPLLKSVNNEAFTRCVNLSIATLLSCQSIGDDAFESTVSLSVFNAPNVISIGESAFAGSSLPHFSSESAGVKIGKSAFYSTRLTEINMSAVEINDAAFSSTTSLETATIYELTKLNYQVFYMSNVRILNLPHCTTLGQESFYQCTNLYNVSLPSCTLIGKLAFTNSHSLASVLCPECTFILNSAFAYCESLEDVWFPKLQIINSNVFFGCIRLGIIDNPDVLQVEDHSFANSGITECRLADCTSIGASCFEHCTNLKSIWMPRVLIAQARAFYNCSQLSSVTCGNLKEIKTNAFSDCPFLNIAALSSLKIEANSFCRSGINRHLSIHTCVVQFFAFADCLYNKLDIENCVVEAYGFGQCGNLTEIKWAGAIPQNTFTDCQGSFVVKATSCTTVGTDAFARSSIIAFEQKTVNDVFVHENAFSHCSQLQRFDTTPTATLSNYAFFECTELVTITALCNLSGSSVFTQCDSLSNITLCNMTSIPENSFQNCHNLQSLDMTDITIIYQGAFMYCYALQSLSCPQLRHATDNCFTSCISLETVDFPLLETIGNSAFAHGAIVSANFPNLRWMNEFAFNGCSELQCAHIGRVVNISNNVFESCLKLENITSDSGALVTNQRSFSGCMALTSIHLQSAGPYAFHGCAHLKTVAGQLTSIGQYAFTGCVELASIDISILDEIPKYAFSHCASLEIDELNVSVIGDYGLEYCTGIRRITGVLRLGSYALRNCTGITELDLPNLTVLYENAFSCMSNLVSFQAISLVKFGGDRIFENCISLVTVVCPSLKDAPTNSFYNCDAIETVELGQQPPETFPWFASGKLVLAKLSWYHNYDIFSNFTWNGLSIPQYNKSRKFSAWKIALIVLASVVVVAFVAVAIMRLLTYYKSRLAVYEAKEQLAMNIIADFG